ncbi:MAG: M3 family metallopeptidase [Bacteroidales bacterium]|nr:M3 family metallopeptidase [Bacteroidales bacterium]
MKKLPIIIMISILVMFGCKQKEQKSSNPFFSEFNTPFNVPAFDKIDTSHYVPAFVKGIADQQAEIDAIVNNTNVPTFDNTIYALDKSGVLLRTINRVFFSLNSANTNPAMQAIAQKVTPLLTKHADNISLNEKLFLKIKAIYENRESSSLDALQKRVIEKYYNDFVRNGANLNEADKEKLREINQKLSTYVLNFLENHLAETSSNFRMILDKKEDLDGLPQGVIEAALDTVKESSSHGKWVFTLQKPSMIPFLQYAKNRSLREKIYRGYYMRCNNNDKFDNKDNLLNIANLRSERSRLLGYKTYAEYSISVNMAKTPEKVYDFLNKLMEPAQKVALRDRDEMQKIIDREGGKFKFDTWDWWYYAEKLRKEKYNLDESEIKPYFELSNVREGMFYVAKKLYGLTFTKLTNVPVYYPDVEAFEVKEADGSHAGVLYLDYFPRESKQAGAWCGNYRDQYYDENGKRVPPIVTVVTNVTKPTADTPSLLTWDEVNTLFHEFGHALHGLSIDGKYNRIAGNLPNDMIELPSQVDENWAGAPEVLNVYAKHYKTGEIIPKELLEKLQKSLTFNQAFETVEYIAASVLDLDWHSIQESKKIDVLDFEKKSMDRIHLMKEIIPRYRSTYFAHIVDGYAAGYYVYLWAAVLDSDVYQVFVDSGDIFNKDLANKFRKHVLTEGGNDEGMVQYNKFRGQEPSLIPLLKKRGLE